MQVTTGVFPDINWQQLTKLNVQRTQQLMVQDGIDAVLVTTLDNWRYLTGLPVYYCAQWFNSNFALLSASMDYPILMPLSGFEQQMKNLAPWFTDIVPLPRAGASDALAPPIAGPWAGTVAGVLKKRELATGTIALDPGLPFYLKDALAKSTPEAELCSAGDVLRKARLIKNPEEIKAIRAACVIDEIAMDRALRSVAAGRTELELAGIIDETFRAFGAENSTANPFVGSGDHPLLGYVTPAKRVFRRGELVRVDIGCSYGGYYSDFSRSVSVGTPDRQMVSVYDTVRRGLQAVSAAVEPGVRNDDLFVICDAAMREASDGEYGMDWWFLGHGLGVGIHEDPMIGRKGSIEAFTLEPGMYFCLEPCVTIPGKGMVGLEDDLIVTDDGAEILTRTEFSLTMR